MKKTVIIYQTPVARIDVARWAVDNGFELEFTPECLKVRREKEDISLYPSTHIDRIHTDCDKLVLWGAFTPGELDSIRAYLAAYYRR